MNPVKYKYKVLLVEDAKISQKMASMVLESVGCELHIVSTGKQAIQLSSEQDFDIILMDLGLPDMDGFSATAEIRKLEARNKKTREVPIIALTAHSGEHVEITCLDQAMDGFLTKPLTKQAAQTLLLTYAKK